MRSKGHEDDCRCGQGECGYIAAERNRYFTGKYMAARDFQDEQTYFLSRHRLHNHLLHGWGIVCGLKVTHHPDYRRNPDSECARRWVVVHPGVALDCCGRELIIEQATAFELPLPPRAAEEDEGGQQSRSYGEGTEGHGEASGGEGGTGGDEVLAEPFLLALRYTEDEIERVPALYSEGACDPARVEANRVRERAEIVVVKLEDVQGDCWRTPGGDPEAPCRDDCGDELPGPGGTCIEPVCPCGEYVPLAYIEVNTDDPSAGFRIRRRGRRYLPTPPDLLTHVVHVNWPHGGEVTLEELNERMGGRLEVLFDRKLREADGDATGVSPLTFVVEYGGIQRDVEFLPYDADSPPALEDDCRAVFTIDPDYIRPAYRGDRRGELRADRRGETIVGNTVYVRLKCDFILDCHGNPVDGNFLRGLLPTGNGVPGGTFESWFHVVYRKEDEGDGNDDADRAE
ncbi:MAG TPA: hypothetical protein VEX60_02045 [Pyrinomonadaceae bacterium]|nr:hypothetical protein [Pyrinomonadaceae bacterium]